MSDATQANASTRSVKEIFFRQIEKLGVFSVLAALLLMFSQNTEKRQEEQQRIDQERWVQLFTQYREDAKEYRKVIEACCHDRLIRLEDAEMERSRREGR